VDATRQARLALFLAASAAILAAALLFALRGGQPTPLPAAADRRPGNRVSLADAGPRAPAMRMRQLRREVKRSARRFLSAFFRYEVGETAPSVRRALRASATPRFAAGLLTAAPRAPGGEFPPPARLGRIEIAFVSVLPPRAVISGVAHRRGGSEWFSFLFEHRGGAWLADGAGE
jgi:hypothetical protein